MSGVRSTIRMVEYHVKRSTAPVNARGWETLVCLEGKVMRTLTVHTPRRETLVGDILRHYLREAYGLRYRPRASDTSLVSDLFQEQEAFVLPADVLDMWLATLHPELLEGL